MNKNQIKMFRKLSYSFFFFCCKVAAVCQVRPYFIKCYESAKKNQLLKKVGEEW